MTTKTIRSLLLGSGLVAGVALLAVSVQSKDADAKPTSSVRTAPINTPISTPDLNAPISTLDSNMSIRTPENRAYRKWCKERNISELKKSCNVYGKCRVMPVSGAHGCFLTPKGKSKEKLGEIPFYPNKDKEKWGKPCRKLVENINRFCK